MVAGGPVPTRALAAAAAAIAMSAAVACGFSGAGTGTGSGGDASVGDVASSSGSASGGSSTGSSGSSSGKAGSSSGSASGGSSGSTSSSSGSSGSGSGSTSSGSSGGDDGGCWADCCFSEGRLCGSCTNCDGGTQDCGGCLPSLLCNEIGHCVDCCLICGAPPYSCVTTDDKSYFGCPGADMPCNPNTSMCTSDQQSGCDCCKM